MMHTRCYPVALNTCKDYSSHSLGKVVPDVLEACDWKPNFAARILVKPNLIRAHALSCTHPEVVGAACSWLLDHGARLTIADSPGFGKARAIADHIGLSEKLRPLGLTVCSLNAPINISVPGGGYWGVSRLALESDAILSLPKVKAHSQMRLTLAVKNMFGCVCGLRKAWAHTIQGNKPGMFEASLVELLRVLPPVAGLADGIIAMHVTGPSGGHPFPLECIGASSSAVALDTALYALLDATPPEIPLWKALQQEGVPGSHPEEIHYPGQTSEQMRKKGFLLPSELLDISFRPQRLFVSLCRRLWKNLRP